MTARIGVVTFPGSLDDRDAQRAVRIAGAEPAALWHGDHDLQGVDDTVFRPGAGGEAVRARHGLGRRPVVVCVSRMVARKGQDVLVEALPEIRSRVPDAALLLVGDGPHRPAVERMVAAPPSASSMVTLPTIRLVRERGSCEYIRGLASLRMRVSRSRRSS